MDNLNNIKELRRRSIVKTLLWRIIGVVWTWIGAYIILLFVPPSKQSAALIATLIVVYHHSTRMVMYYAYERIWASIGWGRTAEARSMSLKERLIWLGGTALVLAVIFFLLLVVHPKLKAQRPAATGSHSAPDCCAETASIDDQVHTMRDRTDWVIDSQSVLTF